MSTPATKTRQPARRYRLLWAHPAGTDQLPPPLTGFVGGFEVHLHLWPPDRTDPPHPQASRVEAGPLAGYWAVWRAH